MHVVSRDDNITMQCQYSSNPVQRVYKWQHHDGSIFPNTTNTHFTVTPHTLTIHQVTPSDAGVYLCNVTNQCGTDSNAFNLEMIGELVQLSDKYLELACSI